MQMYRVLHFSAMLSVFVVFFSIISITKLEASEKPESFHFFPDELKTQRLMFQSSRLAYQYNIALGNFKRINSEWSVENELSVQGDLQRYTFEFDSGTSFSRAWKILNTNVSVVNEEILYTCSGLDCGSSNVWANDYFKVKQLYGLDQTQRYQVSKYPGDKGEQYKIVYLIKRGNRRVLAQVDIVLVKDLGQAEEMSEQDIVNSLNTKRYWLFPTELSGDRRNTWTETVAVLQKVVKAMSVYTEQEPKARFYIVGHDSTGASLTDQTKNGKTLAESVASKLNSLGFKQDLNVHSVGGLAPRKAETLDASRVELVVQP